MYVCMYVYMVYDTLYSPQPFSYLQAYKLPISRQYCFIPLDVHIRDQGSWGLKPWVHLIASSVLNWLITLIINPFTDYSHTHTHTYIYIYIYDSHTPTHLQICV